MTIDILGTTDNLRTQRFYHGTPALPAVVDWPTFRPNWMRYGFGRRRTRVRLMRSH
ncbi:hypothetical protein XM38_028910 [Halomicronema hongdechloris C2206]|uniref:Uncharacterized protein n=1 Tax=Halomicronema hongdechloris C2206 TaxID=1641165 RepID=A0A1Z3HP52_9CYAN|nr:hypothetical protein XM38_028910 [Halomicronema hongdechloris C2206]